MDSGSDSDAENLQYKVLVMGDGAVGKSSLIARYTQGSFGQSYKQTIGLDFFSKKVVLRGNVNVTLQIWDIGGQQIGGKMIQNYIHGCHAVIVVYDVTNRESFKNVEDWHQCVRTAFAAGQEKPLLVVAGNKCDLAGRQVNSDMLTAYCSRHSMKHFMVSAKSGEKVNYMFQVIAAGLAGFDLTKEEMEVHDTKVVATIVNYPAPEVPTTVAAGPSSAAQPGGKNDKEKNKKECVVM